MNQFASDSVPKNPLLNIGNPEEYIAPEEVSGAKRILGRLAIGTSLFVRSAIDQAAYLAGSYPALSNPDIWEYKKLAAETVIREIPVSAKNTVDSAKEKIRKRQFGILALGALTTAQVYGDDVIFYNLYSRVKDSVDVGMPAKLAVPYAVTATTAAIAQGALARRNQKRGLGFNFESENVENADKGKISERIKRVGRHIGKAALTLTTFGVPGHVTVNKFSKREVYAHAVLWGATAPLAYELANIGFKALDNPLIPAGVGLAIIGNRYRKDAKERALKRGKDETND